MFDLDVKSNRFSSDLSKVLDTLETVGTGLLRLPYPCKLLTLLMLYGSEADGGTDSVFLLLLFSIDIEALGATDAVSPSLALS